VAVYIPQPCNLNAGRAECKTEPATTAAYTRHGAPPDIPLFFLLGRAYPCSGPLNVPPEELFQVACQLVSRDGYGTSAANAIITAGWRTYN
jgi:hypothetical protein